MIESFQLKGSRNQQQDCIGHHHQTSGSNPATLLVLSDGFSSHSDGKETAALVVNTFLSTLSMENIYPSFLLMGLDFVTFDIRQRIAANESSPSAKATLLGCLILGDRLSWISVGDSILYLYRNGILARLNADHSMRPILREMVTNGTLTEAEFASDPRLRTLRSYVGESHPALIDYSLASLDLKNGDLILLASDGLEHIPEAQLLEILESSTHESLAEIPVKICSYVSASSAADQDNVSVLAYQH